MSKPAVTIFDIDGPLRGGDIFGWAEFMAKKGLFSHAAIENGRKSQELFIKKNISYAEFARRVVKDFATGLKGKKVSEVSKATRSFVKSKGFALHPYARELVERMNQRGITIAITGQPTVVAEAMMKILPLHMAIGTELKAKNGVYTGKPKRNMVLEKEKIVKELEQHSNIWKFKTKKGEKIPKYFRANEGERNRKTYSFGDRDTDTKFMRHTERPIALNPDHKMKRLANRLGWETFQGANILKRIHRL